MQFTLDLSYLNEISGGDNDFINDILTTFLEEMPKDMEQIETAIQNNDNDLIGKMAHKTKATLQLLGLVELKDLAMKIEQTVKRNENHPEIQAWAKEFVAYMDKVYPNVRALL